jgi:hypothetical protein
MWQVNLYMLGKDANMDSLTGRDWLLFLLIQNRQDPVLKKKIFNLEDNKVTLHNVLAVARQFSASQSTRHSTQGSWQRGLQADPRSLQQRRQRQVHLRPSPGSGT